MITAICFFLVGACAGAFMVFRHLKKLRLPGWVAIAHGLAGATGFALLLLFCLREPGAVLARYAVGIFVGAIVLGCVNVVYHLRGVRHRFALIAIHALTAVSGVGTLTYAAVTYGQRPVEPIPVLPEPLPTSVPVPIAKEPMPVPAPAAAPAPVAVHAPATHALGPAWRDLPVRFDSSHDHPVPASETTLATIAQALADDPSIQLVEVQGHADERGAESANLDLTRARARAVMGDLVSHGVAASRLQSAGYGSRCPARSECRGPGAPASCHDDDALRDDRRVTFVVVQSGGQHLAGPVTCDTAGGS